MRTGSPKTPIHLTEEEQQQLTAKLLNNYKVSIFKGRSDVSATMRQVKAVGLAKGMAQVFMALRRRHQISLG